MLGPQQASALRASMAQIRTRLGGPGFSPHVTICGPYGNAKEPRSIISNVSELLPINLEILKVGFSESEFEGFAIWFENSEPLKRLRLACTINGRKFRAFQPHLSLHYGLEPAGVKEKAVQPEIYDLERLTIEGLAVACVNEAESKWVLA